VRRCLEGTGSWLEEGVCKLLEVWVGGEAHLGTQGAQPQQQP